MSIRIAAHPTHDRDADVEEQLVELYHALLKRYKWEILTRARYIQIQEYVHGWADARIANARVELTNYDRDTGIFTFDYFITKNHEHDLR